MNHDSAADSTDPVDPSLAGRREWVGLAVLALACMLYSMDLTVLHLAVPHPSADLTPSSTELLWIVDIYGFMIAGSLITMGALGDRIGRRRLLMIGATAFGATSILAAFASTPAQLIAEMGRRDTGRTAGPPCQTVTSSSRVGASPGRRKGRRWRKSPDGGTVVPRSRGVAFGYSGLVVTNGRCCAGR